MSPILIDKRDQLKLGLAAVFIIVFAFVAGYLLGQKQAALSNTYKAGAADLTAMSTEVEKPTNAVRPTELDQLKLLDSVQLPTATKDIVGSEQITEDDSSTAGSADVTKEEEIKRTQKSEKPAIATANKSENMAGDNVVQSNIVQVSKVAEESSNGNSIKFSIQVAVYGRMKNAEKMVKSLQEKKLDAYISDYSNEKYRYNVRFGHFKEKQAALSALKGYVDMHQGKGYLINYSAENIVHVSAELAEKQDSKDQINSDEVTNSPADVSGKSSNVKATVPD